MGSVRWKSVLSMMVSYGLSCLIAQGLTPGDYAARTKVTFSGYDRGETLTNFPALIILGTNVPGFSYAQFTSPSGGDLRITDASETNEINFEIEEWNTNGLSYVWVQVPTLSTTGDCIWVYWGHAIQTNHPDSSSDGSTWSQDYLGVWHLHDTNGVNTFPDSGLGSHDGTNTGTINVDGQIGDAQDWEGADSITLPPASVSNLSTQVTFSLWQFGDVALQPQANWIFGGGIGASTEFNATLPFSDESVVWTAFASGDWAYDFASANEYEGAWNHWVFTKDQATGIMQIFLNGSLWKTQSGRTATYDPVTSFKLGSWHTGSSSYDGYIDEFRVANVARGSNWIWASHQTEGSNSSFQTYGTNEPSASVPEVSFAAPASSGPESYTNPTIQVVLDIPPTNTVTVQYAVSGGSATGSGTDYTLDSGTLVFAINQATQTITFTVVDDELHEPGETIEVTLNNATNAQMGSIATHTYTISASDHPTVSPDEYTARTKITFSGYDRGETLTNFPALVILSTNILGFSYADFVSPIGGDLRITDSSETNEINFEIEEWNTNGDSFVWVQLPTLSTSNDCIWIYWGNESATDLPAYTSDGSTWSQDYLGVWHLHDTNGPDTFPDSGTGAHHGTNVGTVNVDGKIGDAQDWEGSADFIFLPPASVSNISSQVTFSLWLYGDPAFQPQNNAVFGGGDSGSTTEFYAQVPRFTEHIFWSFGGTDLALQLATSNEYEGSWQHWTFTKDTASGIMQIFLNGSLWMTQSSRFTAYTPVERFRLGAYHYGAGVYDGYIDEFRVANVVRGSNWLWTSHQTEGSNGSFQTYSPAEFKLAVNFITASQSVSEDQSAATIDVVLSAISTNEVTVQYAVTGGSATGSGVDYSLADGSLVFLPGQLTQTIYATIADDDLLEDSEAIQVTLSSPTNAALSEPAIHDLTILANDGWAATKERVRVTFDGYTLNATLTNFPTLIVLNTNISGFSYADFAYSDGRDLRFVDATETNELAYEIESWDTNGSSHIWVQIPLLSSSNDYIWACWGDPANSSFPGYTSDGSTWSEDYLGVWHMHETIGGDQLPDSSGNARHGTNVGTVNATGQIGNARDWEDADSVIIPHELFSNNTSAITFSVWQYGDAALQPQSDYIFSGVRGASLAYYAILPDAAGNVIWVAPQGNFVSQLATTNEYEAQWNHWVFTKDTVTDIMNVYLNGQLWLTGSFKTAALLTPLTSFRLGSWATGTFNYDGYIDEFRISNIAKGSNWVWASHQTEGSNSTFQSCDAVETVRYASFVAPNSSGPESQTNISFDVVLSDPPTETATVQYAVSGGSAIGAGADYTLAAGMLTFDVGEMTQSIDLVVHDDGDTEPPETIEIALSEPTNASLNVATHIYTIWASDGFTPTATFSLATSTGDEFETGATVQVTLSDLPDDTVTVQYAVSGGTASGGIDYAVSAGTLTFGINTATQYIDLGVIDDLLNEPAETIELTLSDPTNAILGSTTEHTYTILSSDGYALFEHGYNFRMKTCFDGYYRGETLTNFPALVVLSTDIPGFSYSTFASDSGQDLRFSDETETNALAFEIEEWNTNGASYIWVQIPALASTQDYIWAHWGNATETNLPASSSDGSVWAQNYLGVWHMNSIAAPNIVPDSAGGSQHGTNIGTVNVAGQIGNGQDWEGTDYVSLPPQAFNGNIPFEVTISAWQYGDVETQPQADYLFSGSLFGSLVFLSSVPYNDESVSWFAGSASDYATRIATSNEYEGAWNHWVFTKDAVSGVMEIYLNGEPWTNATGKTSGFNSLNVFRIGSSYNGINNYDGIIDEFRVSSIVRGSNWLWASHQTEGSNSSFQSYGTIYGSEQKSGPIIAFASAASSGPESQTNVDIAVTLSFAPSSTVTVEYAVSGGTALGSGVDYTLANGVLTFEPGETTENIWLTVNDDALTELDETIEVMISTPSNGVIGATYTHTYTIEASDEHVYASSFSVNGGTNVTEIQMLEGDFDIELTMYHGEGVETTNDVDPFFAPSFNILDPLGNLVLTGGVFSGVAYGSPGFVVVSNDNLPAFASAVSGTYTMQWSAVSSNGEATIDHVALSNGTLMTFTVEEDDDEAPIVSSFSIRGTVAIDLHVGLSTVSVAALRSGSGWSAEAQVYDAESGINVNGTSTTHPDHSPYMVLIDPMGVERLTNVFNLTFTDGGATSLRPISNSAPAGIAMVTTGVWTARVVISDNDEDWPGDRATSTEDYSFMVVDPPNFPPIVTLIDNIPAVWLPDTADLEATIRDDGQPYPPGVVTVQWTKVSGPGNITFGNASDESTSASFSTNGDHVVRLTAYDTEWSYYRQITVTVNAAVSPSIDPDITWSRVIEGGSGGRQLSAAYAGGIQSGNPTLVDFDGDGDLDLFSGEEYGSIVYFENIGTVQNAQWEEPLWGVADVIHASRSAPEFVDIDDDGDMDLFVGGTYGIIFLENTGSVVSAAWTPPVWIVGQYGSDEIRARPAFADIDNDGDQDLFYGETFGRLWFVENTGTASEAAWSPGVYGYEGIDVGFYAAPDFGDLDGDGDLDLVIGESDATVYYYQNYGTPSSPNFLFGVADYAGVDLGNNAMPSLGDIDNDGDLDLVVGDLEVQQVFYENLGSATNAVWAAPLFEYIQIDLGPDPRPAFVDIDADGDLDMFAGGDGGSIVYLENRGAATVPLWNTVVIDIGGIDIGNHEDSSPTFGDLDGDGDMDMLIGELDGTLNFAENFGTPTQFTFAGSTANYAGIDVGSEASPALFDIDADDDEDLFVGDVSGRIHFYENTGTVSTASWANVDYPYAGIDVGQHGIPAFADMDGDGDADLIIGTQDGNLHYHENVGTPSNPSWAAPIVSFGDISVVAEGSPQPEGRAAPVVVDIDNDGDIDLFAADVSGGLNFYRNKNPKLRVVPPNRTIKASQGHQFRVAPPQDASWSFVQNNSDGTINPTNGYYTSGTNAPALDVIQAVDTNGAFGRAHINVIDPANASSVGKAIVIAGAKSLDDPVWEATDIVANKAYRTLLRRGFAKTNIYYLSFDPDQDVDEDGLTNDVDDVSSLANASYAFNTFAQNADRLFVFMADHGSDSAGEGYLRLSPGEQLSATQLNSWVSGLQNSDTNMDVTIAMDFCYSGSFLDELTYTGSARRVNIASASSNELTYFIAGGLVSFSDAFLTALQLGYDFNNAFLVARGAMSTYQLAQMDDNNDGIYSKGIDGANATNRLGATFVAGQDIPQIGSITPNQTITTGTTVTLIADTISSVFPIERVWCLVVPPSHAPDTDGGVPVLDIPEIDLAYNASLDRYEADFDGFTEQGVYKVIFIAKDIWDSVSIPKQSYINQGNYDERAIIVAGGPKSDPNWSNISFIAQATYNVLEARLFDHDSIYYISADTNIDIDADGTNDVDAVASLNAISNAIATWAASADRLNIFLIGDGSNNLLRVDTGALLDYNDFDSWLDDFQSATRSVNVVMDFDGSGGFATNLVPPAGKERINIASTRPNRTSVMREGGLVSFSQYFLTEIFGGKTIGDATTKARKAIRRASGRARQRGGIDDSGNGKLNEKNVDGIIARQRYIGAAFATGDDSPNIASVVPDTALTNTSSFTIWVADVTDVDGISNVWCVITPPDYDGVGELPREDLSYDAGDERYELLYTNFSQAGSYQLTFYASDNEGEVSPAVQSTVAKADEYEDDDTYLTASILNGDIFQFHSFHDDNDVDWVRFYAVSNYEYEIETFHFSTNVDTILNVYQQLGDGSLNHIVVDEDEFGFDEGELTGLTFPASGFYYVEVSQYLTNGSGQGSYEVVIYVPVADGTFAIVAGDDFSGQPLPMGSYALIDGVSNSFNGGPAIPNVVLSAGPHTIEVVCPFPGYIPREDPSVAGQVGNAANLVYGNPRIPNALDVEEGEIAGGVLFMYRSYATVEATVRDKWTKGYIEDVPPRFDAYAGFLTNYTVNKRPFDGSYATPWKTGSDGAFPSTVLAPAVNSDLIINMAGYEPFAITNVLTNGQVGVTNDLGTIELTPIDTNGNNIADFWEALHFGTGTNVNPNQDSDNDGNTDGEEYKLGTDPDDADDNLMTEEMMTTNGLMIYWAVEAGRSYEVLANTNLLTTNWFLVGGPWAAAPGQTNMSWTETNESVQGRCYRVEMVAP